MSFTPKNLKKGSTTSKSSLKQKDDLSKKQIQIVAENRQEGELLVDQSESYIFNQSSNDSDNNSPDIHASPYKQGKLRAKEDVNLNDSVHKCIPPPNPILPRHITVPYEPPKCPFKMIKFIQLKKFMIHGSSSDPQMMNEGYDQVGKRKLLDGNNQNIGDNDGQNGDEFPVFVNNIVFCRNPTILKDKESCMSMLSLIQHENILDIKQLIKANMPQTASGGEEQIKKRALLQKSSSSQKLFSENESAVYRLQDSSDKTLLFESRFESGNLFLAQKLSDIEYNLLMQNDINTTGHTQWFFFRVQNTIKGSSVKFNIINYSKPDSLFNYGMKVTIYSEKQAQDKKMGWYRGCSNISYNANKIIKPKNKGTYYSLTFTHDFEYDDDTVFFSYCFPYTYTDLMDDLAAIDSDPLKSQFTSRKTLCKTLGGVKCEYLTVTSRENIENINKRKAIVISGRAHPGETVGSWMMKGVLEFITDPHNQEAKILRDNFIFKIIPMLNPDGVINGNYRCSLAGCDLNRRWKTPSKVIHPTVYHTKKLIKSLHQERTCLLYCDLHGHSRKQNVFMYGCNNQKQPEETRLFPYLLSKLSPYFSFEYSRFGNQKSKESTARMSLFKEMKTCPNVFTMESTFSGMDMGPFKGMHITTQGLESLGRDLCRTILVYTDLFVPQELKSLPMFESKLSQQSVNAIQSQAFTGSEKKNLSENLDKKAFKEDKVSENPMSSFKAMFFNELKENKELLKKGDGDSSSGSDSAPSDDNLEPEDIIKIMPVVDKKTKQQLLKSKKKKESLKDKRQPSKTSLRRQSSKQQLTEPLKQEPKKAQEQQNFQRKIQKNSLIQEEEKKKPSEIEEIKEVKEEEENQDDTKKKQTKPKPIMIDAWTQTDRSDYSIIKSRMLSHQNYANSLVNKEQDNPLRMKASKNYHQQYAKTPTQAQENIFYKSDSNVKQNLMLGNNFNQPQSRFRNLMEANNQLMKKESPQMTMQTPSHRKSEQITYQSLNKSHTKQSSEGRYQSTDLGGKVNNQHGALSMNSETLNALGLDLFGKRGTEPQTSAPTQYLLTSPQANKNYMQSPQMSSNGKPSISNVKQELLFPVLNNKYNPSGPEKVLMVQSDKKAITNQHFNIQKQQSSIKLKITPRLNTNGLIVSNHNGSTKNQLQRSRERSLFRRNSHKNIPKM